MLFRAAAEATLTIAADPKHLGASVGITSVLHTWGSAMTHHPHVHMIVPGGGLSDDGAMDRCRPEFFLPVRVLSRLFRGIVMGLLAAAHAAGSLQFFGNHAPLADKKTFSRIPGAAAEDQWVVYARSRSAGPKPCCAISRATPTASPSRTAGWSPPTTAPSRSAARTIASTAPAAGSR